MEKLYYKISEAAAILGENTTTVRFWSNRFNKFISPHRNAKGNRMFTPSDIEQLRRISYLTHDCGMSLDATERKLSGGSEETDKMLQVRDSLTKIREQLEQIRESL